MPPLTLFQVEFDGALRPRVKGVASGGLSVDSCAWLAQKGIGPQVVVVGVGKLYAAAAAAATCTAATTDMEPDLCFLLWVLLGCGCSRTAGRK